MEHSSREVLICLVIIAVLGVNAAQDEQTSSSNSTTTAKRLFAYAGPLLPSDWTL